jgi:hypothetical protein
VLKREHDETVAVLNMNHMAFCGRCAATLRPQYLLTDPTWAGIVAGFAARGYHAPDRDKTAVNLVRLPIIVPKRCTKVGTA